MTHVSRKNGTQSRRLVGSLWLAAVALCLLPSCSAAGSNAAEPVKIPAPAETPGETAARVALINHSSPADDYYSGQFCGAVLIRVDLLATASHCVAGRDASIVDAVVGARNLCKGQPMQGERIAVTEILSPAGPLREVALLRLGTDSKAQPVTLSAGQPEQGTSVGWGGLSSGGVSPCEVKHTEQLTVSADECDLYADAVESYAVSGTYLCALPPPGSDRNTCQGDSGGPLVATEDGKEVVYALTLGGGSCRADSPGLYVTAEAVAAAALELAGSPDGPRPPGR